MSGLLPVSSLRPVGREGNVMWELGKGRTWPDDCPACSSRMEFVLGPVVHRRCRRRGCGRTVFAEDIGR